MPSPSSLAVTILLRLSGRKKHLADAEHLHRALAHRRLHPVSAVPPKLLRRKVETVAEDRCGWTCHRLTPRGAPVSGQVVYLHGGAYVAEISPLQWWAMAEIAHLAGVEVTVPIYPLAPSATAERTVATATELVAEIAGENAAGLDLIGDSAGGGMALAVVQRLRLRGLPQPRRVVLIAPWLDVECADPVAARIAPSDVMLDIPGLIEAGRLYAGELAVTDARVSPLYGELSGLAPISVFCGTADVVNADARALVARASAVGVDIDYRECAGGQHCYPLLPTREGKRARKQIADLLRR